MNPFQILALIVIGVFFVVTLAAAFRGSIVRRDGLLWAVVWLATAVAIIWPGVTRIVAKALGIGRGADLVLYCAVVIMLIGFLMTYSRLSRLQQDLTTVVRNLAMRDVRFTPHAACDGDDPKSEAPVRGSGG